MSLTDNKIINLQQVPFITKLSVVSGLITIYKGAHLAYKGASLGYVGLAADELTSRYVGVSLDNLAVTAAQNLTNGTFLVQVYHKASKNLMLMNIASTITIANEGDNVYMKNDDQVDLTTGVSFSQTNGKVGVIRQYVGANQAWVQFQD